MRCVTNSADTKWFNAPCQSQCREVSDGESECAGAQMNMDAGSMEMSVDAGVPEAIVDADVVDMESPDAIDLGPQQNDAAIVDMNVVDAMRPLMESNYSPVIDTFLQSTQNIAMAAREEIRIGNGPGNEQYIALIRFDLADLINVEVVSASMCFTPSEQQELNVNASWQISRIQNDWNAELGWAGLGVLGDPADVKNVEVVILNEVCVDVTEIVQSGSNERVNYGFRIESLAGAQGTVALKSSESAGGGGPLLKLSYRTR